jgi:hypothetical protein
MHINRGYRVTRNGNALQIAPIIVSLVDPKKINTFPTLSPQGITDDVIIYLRTYKTFFQITQEMKNILTTLIKIEISKNKNVGLPILVKVIYPDGSKWETEHAACQ